MVRLAVERSDSQDSGGTLTGHGNVFGSTTLTSGANLQASSYKWNLDWDAYIGEFIYREWFRFS